MAKLSLGLLGLLVVCALGLVTSQHQSRRLFVDLEREQERARQLEVEFGQLQIEAGTLGLHTRVAGIAASQLGLAVVDPGRIRVVVTHPAIASPAETPGASIEGAARKDPRIVPQAPDAPASRSASRAPDPQESAADKRGVARK